MNLVTRKWFFICIMISIAGFFGTGANAKWIALDSRVTDSTPASVDVVQSNLQMTSLDIKVPGVELSVKKEQQDDFTLLSIPESGVLSEPGRPLLPTIRKFIAVPLDSEVVLDVAVVSEHVIDALTVYPAQPQYKRSEPRPPFQMDLDLYRTDALFPASWARITDDVMMRDFRVVLIEISPVRYNPVEQTAVVAELNVNVRTTGGTSFGPSHVFPSFHRIYSRHIENFDQMRIGTRSDPEPMLIIASDTFLSEMASFVEWKTKRGLEVTLVGTSATGTGSAAVKSYIQNVYNTWNPKPVYILLVGDSTQINPLYGIGSCASDYKFTQLNGTDITPDAFISRLSAQNVNELRPQLDKIMHYESMPADGVWLDKLTGISSSLSGSMGINDDQRMNEIATRFHVHNPNSQADQLYDSNGQGTTANITAAVNAGRFWVGYCGHGDGTGWSGPVFTNTNVNALSNGYFTPFVMDVSCLNGGFDSSSDCFAERWMKGGTVGNAHGAVAMYSSSTSTAWDPPAIMAWGVCYSVAGNSGGSVPGGHFRMGEMTYDGMLYMVSQIGSGSDSQEVMQQYVLFGDCSTFFRSDALISPTVTHLPSAPLAPYPFQVTVSNGGSPIESAVVCAYKPGDVHVTAQTNAQGIAILDIAPTTIGDMIITVSGQNLNPYEALVTVAPAGCGVILVDRESYNCSDTIQISVFDADLNLSSTAIDTATATISSTSESTPETMQLMETGVDTSEFTATIQTSSTQGGAGYLLLSHGDTISAQYHDASCDGLPEDVSDSAIADCQGPVISNITISDVTTNSAVISWTTSEMSIGTVQYGIEVPPVSSINETAMATSHEITLEGLSDSTVYFFQVASADMGGNITTDNAGGTYYFFITLQFTSILDANMDVNPGWTHQGQWAWGDPTGALGDPGTGHTGTNVVGYNLSGAYGNNLSLTYTTTQAFSCAESSHVFLGFWKWLGIEESIYDHANIQISTNAGTSWQTVWNFSGGTLEPSAWEYVEYDLTQWAANQPDVRLRWGISSDSYLTYCGWNIDDVLVWGEAPASIPTPTPRPTFTPTPIPTLTPTPTPSSTPTVPPTATPVITRGIHLTLNGTSFSANDPFHLEMDVMNDRDTGIDVDVYILLDVYGLYFCWPSWTNLSVNVDNKQYHLDPMQLHHEDVLQFVWPAGTGSADNLGFIGAVFNEGSFDLFGDPSFVSWGYR